VGDTKLPMIKIITDIKNIITSKQNIDAALIVLKKYDYRDTIQELYAIRTITKMIANSKAEDTFIVVTHCDKEKPSEEFITGKLNSFKEYGPLAIPPENVIKFDNTTESLSEFISKLKPSNMHFHENLEEKAIEL
jgi:hypothetical protein